MAPSFFRSIFVKCVFPKSLIFSVLGLALLVSCTGESPDSSKKMKAAPANAAPTFASSADSLESSKPKDAVVGAYFDTNDGVVKEEYGESYVNQLRQDLKTEGVPENESQIVVSKTIDYMQANKDNPGVKSRFTLDANVEYNKSLNISKNLISGVTTALGDSSLQNVSTEMKVKVVRIANKSPYKVFAKQNPGVSLSKMQNFLLELTYLTIGRLKEANIQPVDKMAAIQNVMDQSTQDLMNVPESAKAGDANEQTEQQAILDRIKNMLSETLVQLAEPSPAAPAFSPIADSAFPVAAVIAQAPQPPRPSVSPVPLVLAPQVLAQEISKLPEAQQQLLSAPSAPIEPEVASDAALVEAAIRGVVNGIVSEVSDPKEVKEISQQVVAESLSSALVTVQESPTNGADSTNTDSVSNSDNAIEAFISNTASSTLSPSALSSTSAPEVNVNEPVVVNSVVQQLVNQVTESTQIETPNITEILVASPLSPEPILSNTSASAAPTSSSENNDPVAEPAPVHSVVEQVTANGSATIVENENTASTVSTPTYLTEALAVAPEFAETANVPSALSPQSVVENTKVSTSVGSNDSTASPVSPSPAVVAPVPAPSLIQSFIQEVSDLVVPVVATAPKVQEVSVPAGSTQVVALAPVSSSNAGVAPTADFCETLKKSPTKQYWEMLVSQTLQIENNHLNHEWCSPVTHTLPNSAQVLKGSAERYQQIRVSLDQNVCLYQAGLFETKVPSKIAVSQKLSDGEKVLKTNVKSFDGPIYFKVPEIITLSNKGTVARGDTISLMFDEVNCNYKAGLSDDKFPAFVSLETFIRSKSNTADAVDQTGFTLELATPTAFIVPLQIEMQNPNSVVPLNKSQLTFDGGIICDYLPDAKNANLVNLSKCNKMITSDMSDEVRRVVTQKIKLKSIAKSGKAFNTYSVVKVSARLNKVPLANLGFLDFEKCSVEMGENNTLPAQKVSLLYKGQYGGDAAVRASVGLEKVLPSNRVFNQYEFLSCNDVTKNNKSWSASKVVAEILLNTKPQVEGLVSFSIVVKPTK